MTKSIQPHLHLSEVHEVCILCGNPDRVEKFSMHLLEAEQVAKNRGLVAINGITPDNGIPVSVLTTGMGCPSTAIILEEAYRAGAQYFIRVGSTGALQPGINVGDVLIPHAAIRDERTSLNLAPIAFPAVASPVVSHALETAAVDLNVPVRTGIVWTTDVFYATDPEEYQRWAQYGAICVEMELSTIFIFGSVRGVQTGGIVVVDGNLAEGTMKDSGELGDTSESFTEGEKRAIQVAIKAIDKLFSG
ncbi:MAG: nucleoside phosphorylase [Candidatus Hodarchaeales archaeon]|jgi:uridine phosphorylase